ncbi:stage III sporulation protein SpoIIIAB [Peptococcaceae bacterium]|nr:stage III sporulation protein SpoIIIAB [Peptococcaceae bacterium]
MLTFFGAILILFACSYVGFAVAEKYRRRPQDLRYLQSALQMLETEIAYGATPLPDALGQVSRRCEKDIAILFTVTVDHLISGDGGTVREAWEMALNHFCRQSAINSADAAVLTALGGNLGISDQQDQIKHLQLAREQLKIEASKAEVEAVKNVKLYNYLGFLSGLTIVIIFI